jgi:hypothetical protein
MIWNGSPFHCPGGGEMEIVAPNPLAGSSGSVTPPFPLLDYQIEIPDLATLTFLPGELIFFWPANASP